MSKLGWKVISEEEKIRKIPSETLMTFFMERSFFDDFGARSYSLGFNSHFRVISLARKFISIAFKLTLGSLEAIKN